MIIYRKVSDNMISRLDPNEEAVALILSDEDKWNIAHMPDEMSTYCVYPDTMDPDEALEFIRECKATEGVE